MLFPQKMDTLVIQEFFFYDSPLICPRTTRQMRSKLWGSQDFCCCYSSVAQLCLTLSNPTDCRTSGFPVLPYLPQLSQTHVHCQWCHPTISSSVIPFSSCLQSFPASGSFPMSQLFTSGGQSIGASVSSLPMDIQGWFPLGLTNLISWLSKGLSRVFFSTTVRRHQFFGVQSFF